MQYDEELYNKFYQYQDNVDKAMSPTDRMLGLDEDPVHYSTVGQSALRCIRMAMLLTGRTDLERILDLPSGHGRVTRVLRAAYPGAEIVVSDILKDGIDFCASQFKAVPVLSNTNIDLIPDMGKFDLIFVGSLFTHLNASQIHKFLLKFKSMLSYASLLLFSTHGHHVASLYRENKKYPSILTSYDKTGFGYEDYANTKGYGNTLSSISWVVNKLAEIGGLKLLYYWEQGWDNYQDMIAVTPRN